MSRKPALMLQGTGSNVGKSILVAGLARALVQRGIKVAPFKPQNMSNNAGVADGGEIGRAQMLQARAARLAPSIHMNPVLLKPESEIGAQIIVQGRLAGTMRAHEYGSHKMTLMPNVLESFQALEADYDLILVEGAGSPAEINLRAGDIANMGFAEAADVPVVLIGDIDRGGVIASVVGTHTVLPVSERQRIKGFLINKFRGDVSLFDDGLSEIAKRTGWRPLGVVPYFSQARRLPAEDVLDLQTGVNSSGSFTIAVPKLPRIANFDDLDPLASEPDVSVHLVESGEPLPQNADLILLPGSKSTISDLEFLKAEGWDIDIAAHLRQGRPVIGLCGGYQMLGRRISDPHGVEGPARSIEGLGHLDIETTLSRTKTTSPARGVHCASGLAVTGYEIHLGETTGSDCERPFAHISGRTDGAHSPNGLVCGTYMHGTFSADAFRRRYLQGFGLAASDYRYDQAIDQCLDELAQHLETHLDIGALLDIAYARAA
uniref:cobyric acid synthase n=1 Tax=Pararhizobium sp. IMCC3301 TaxID=3067904 RepID=UPI0027409225|nr:cobyric acid synthase [Pararhizobium sp. IMCC3301]